MAKRNKIISYLVLTLLGLIVLFPIFWMVSISFRNNNQVFSIPVKIIPDPITIESYKTVLTNNRYLQYFANSYIISLTVTFLSLIIGIFAAYGFSRYDFRGSKIMNLFIVATQTIPPVTLLIPYFILITQIRLYNTYAGLILTYASFCLPYAILMMTGYFNSISKELDEAVLIDGGSRVRALWSVIVPSAIPGIISTLIYTFILAWNEFMFALTLIKDDAMRTVPVGIALLKGEFSTEWNTIMAFSLLGSLPVLLLYFLAQRYFISGLTAGAVKG